MEKKKHLQQQTNKQKQKTPKNPHIKTIRIINSFTLTNLTTNLLKLTHSGTHKINFHSFIDLLIY